jgi:signal transduction histidine kinase
MQVLLGLQSNALKFTKKGKVVVRVQIVLQNLKRYIQFSVIDTGIGIAKDDQKKLFKLFGFVQDSKQMNTKGIGLGLVISEQIVTQFNGDITFESEKDVGSTFTFRFML